MYAETIEVLLHKAMSDPPLVYDVKTGVFIVWSLQLLSPATLRMVLG